MTCLTAAVMLAITLIVPWPIGHYVARHIDRCNEKFGRCKHIGFSPKGFYPDTPTPPGFNHDGL